ncbi:hypothetical protein ACFOON_06210 [Novosphingobium piscinae]|uniref:Exo-alpha-sialidase n=1 Tax=Novosphingobium piscinae TaxID=1507448 RepID=A0A7X1KQW7_9SPHN|nr:sialidase family protein [Novosphingobium piscinae]MBC2670122.1 exo-alpha-sialidase [Novosphingobium piscinae]
MATDGYQWQSVPFGGGGYVDGFAYHPRQPDILYARTDIGGAYRFDFASRRWLPLLDHLARADGDLMGVLSIALDPQAPDRILLATGLYLNQWARRGAILRSDDRGKTWQVTELPIRIGGNSDGRGSGERLAIDPADGRIVYFGSNQDGFWKSTDGGESFARTGAEQLAFSLVAADPEVANRVWAGSADQGGALLLSNDGGNHFTPVAGLPQMVPQRIAFAPDGSLYVTFARGAAGVVLNPSGAEDGRVWKREGRTGPWRDVTPPSPGPGAKGGFSGLAVRADGTVAVSTLDRWWPGDDIYLSADGGRQWQALSSRARLETGRYPWLASYIGTDKRIGHWISDLQFNPFRNSELVYGTGYGLWMSRDLGSAAGNDPVAFDFAVDNLEETATLQLTSPSGGATLLAAFGDVAGAAWDDLARTPAAGLFKPVNETNFSIDYAGLTPGVLARTAAGAPGYGFYSSNGGVSWKPFATSPYRPPAKDEPWRGPGIVAVSARGTSLVWAPEKAGLFHSSDMGRTWSPATGLPERPEFTFRPLADKAVDGLFYVHDQPGSAIYASGDGGASFTPIAEGLPRVETWEAAQLAIVPGRMRDLWLAMPRGLFHSADSKSKMVQIKHVDAAWQVTFGAPLVQGAYPTVFLWGKVRGQEGLWRSSNAGASWLRINDDQHRYGELRAMVGDMLEPGTLYLAPHGRGIIVGRPLNRPAP